MFETRQISYIVKEAYNTIFGRFTLENKAGDEVILFVEDFDGFVIIDGTDEVEVSEAVMLAWLVNNAPGVDEIIQVTEDNVLVVKGSVGDFVETDDAVVVFTETGLIEAIAAAKEVIVFGADIETENKLNLTYGVTIDGAGFKLTSEAAWAIDVNVGNKGEPTIKNLTIDCTAGGIYLNEIATVEKCTIIDATAAIGVATELDLADLTIEGNTFKDYTVQGIGYEGDLDEADEADLVKANKFIPGNEDAVKVGKANAI